MGWYVSLILCDAYKGILKQSLLNSKIFFELLFITQIVIIQNLIRKTTAK